MQLSSHPPATVLVQGLAYDRALRNRRPIFAMTQRVSLEGNAWHTERTWTAAGPDTVALERAHKHQGSLHISTELPTLGELASAVVTTGSSDTRTTLMTRLSSHRTGGQVRERRLTLPHPLVTLATLPLFIAQHWERLLRGEALAASYLVLKVQRAATVDLLWQPQHAQGAHVAVTPRNWLLRALFGSTRLYTQGDQPSFLRQEGLLDPRDLRPNGRWKEYLGVLEFDTPWNLASLRQEEAHHELA